MEEYAASVGGHDELFRNPASTARRGLRERKSESSPAPVRRSRRPKSAALANSTEWNPPEGPWEDEIASIDGCDVEGGKLAVYVCWETGHKTRHDASVLYKKCPQKVSIWRLKAPRWHGY